MVCVCALVCQLVLCVSVGLSALLLFLLFRHPDLKEGVTDQGLLAIASAGCGENLTLLDLSCVFWSFFGDVGLEREICLSLLSSLLHWRARRPA